MANLPPIGLFSEENTGITASFARFMDSFFSPLLYQLSYLTKLRLGSESSNSSTVFADRKPQLGCRLGGCEPKRPATDVMPKFGLAVLIHHHEIRGPVARKLARCTRERLNLRLPFRPLFEQSSGLLPTWKTECAPCGRWSLPCVFSPCLHSRGLRPLFRC